jgi:hypothetical protein
MKKMMMMMMESAAHCTAAAIQRWTERPAVSFVRHDDYTCREAAKRRAEVCFFGSKGSERAFSWN